MAHRFFCIIRIDLEKNGLYEVHAIKVDISNAVNNYVKNYNKDLAVYDIRCDEIKVFEVQE